MVAARARPERDVRAHRGQRVRRLRRRVQRPPEPASVLNRNKLRGGDALCEYRRVAPDAALAPGQTRRRFRNRGVCSETNPRRTRAPRPEARCGATWSTPRTCPARVPECAERTWEGGRQLSPPRFRARGVARGGFVAFEEKEVSSRARKNALFQARLRSGVTGGRTRGRGVGAGRPRLRGVVARRRVRRAKRAREGPGSRRCRTSRSDDGCAALAGGTAASGKLNSRSPADAVLEGTKRSEYTVSFFPLDPGGFESGESIVSDERARTEARSGRAGHVGTPRLPQSPITRRRPTPFGVSVRFRATRVP